MVCWFFIVENKLFILEKFKISKFNNKVWRWKNNPFDNFKILNFISQFKLVDVNDQKIQKIIKKCEFENLQNQEKKKGFKRKGKEFFFRKGKIDEWKDGLPKLLSNTITKEFKEEMEELGYL